VAAWPRTATTPFKLISPHDDGNRVRTYDRQVRGDERVNLEDAEERSTDLALGEGLDLDRRS